MMDISSIVYSDKPITLRHHILLQEVAAGNYRAMHELLLYRTSLTAEEAYELDDEELNIVLTRLAENIKQAIVLQSLGNTLNDNRDKQI